MTGTCQACRHWSHEKFASVRPPLGWAECRCEHEDLGRAIFGGEATTPVLNRSGTPTLGYARDLIFTAPHFGCVLWEAKP